MSAESLEALRHSLNLPASTSPASGDARSRRVEFKFDDGSSIPVSEFLRSNPNFPVVSTSTSPEYSDVRSLKIVKSLDETFLAIPPDDSMLAMPDPILGTYSRHNADQSAVFMKILLEKQQPFMYLRYGDGALECINGLGRGRTCDGEVYSPELAAGMQQAWDACVGKPNVYVGDWLSASFGTNRSTEYRAEYAALIGDKKPNFLHFEALLLTRQSEALLNFYKAVAADKRRKLYIGPHEHGPAADILGCQHYITSMGGLLPRVDDIERSLGCINFDVLFWAAGMAGTIPVVKTWQRFPDRTYINLGSAMDPLTRGKTRSGQLTQVQAARFLHDLLV